MRHALAIFCIVGLSLGAVNALDPPLTRYEFAEPHMGTLVRITLFAADEATAKKAAKAAFDRIEELNRSMSDYIDDSELMRLSKSSGGLPVAVSDDLFTVLEMSQEVARLSGGAFDVTVGPVVQLWRRSRRTRELPQPEALKKALAVVGYEKMRLDRSRRTVQLLVAGMRLDVGGIAKGYAADMMLAVLRRFGIPRAMIAVGGDIAVGDPPPERNGWKIGVDTPAGKNGPTNFVLLLRNQAVSTAGDANQYVNIDGKRYSHIVDPHTGMGLIGKRSVTIVARTGLVTDGFDTAICVMGRQRGMKLVEDRPELAGLFVEEKAEGELEITQSKRFKEVAVSH
ncbi:MAG TPA: FAD:protein FMN transferase [Gemmataceae bacterium]|jgi:thiamine biosynthesis lipoprotein|nr:FAD:protein FMN transferase [Gemmataceae bacterium]